MPWSALHFVGSLPLAVLMSKCKEPGAEVISLRFFASPLRTPVVRKGRKEDSASTQTAPVPDRTIIDHLYSLKYPSCAKKTLIAATTQASLPSNDQSNPDIASASFSSMFQGIKRHEKNYEKRFPSS